MIASLPLVSVLGMIWLWHDTHGPELMAAHVGATLWYIAPSVPMFVLFPILLQLGVGFWLTLGIGCALTLGLYLLMQWASNRCGISL